MAHFVLPFWQFVHDKTWQWLKKNYVMEQGSIRDFFLLATWQHISFRYRYRYRYRYSNLSRFFSYTECIQLRCILHCLVHLLSTNHVYVMLKYPMSTSKQAIELVLFSSFQISLLFSVKFICRYSGTRFVAQVIGQWVCSLQFPSLKSKSRLSCLQHFQDVCNNLKNLYNFV